MPKIQRRRQWNSSPANTELGPHEDAGKHDLPPASGQFRPLRDISNLALYSSDSTLEDIVAELARITGYPLITVELYDPERRVMIRKASLGMPQRSASFEVPLERSLSAIVAQTGIPISESDIGGKVGPMYKTLLNLKIRTFLCVPMAIDGNIIGTLSFGHTKIAPVDENFTDWINLAANHIAFFHYRMQAEEALLRLHRLESIAILNRGLSHDFNNLLMTMLGNITLARMRLGDREPLATQRFAEAEKAMLEARNLTDQLLAFSKEGLPVKKILHVGPVLEDSVRRTLRGSAVKVKIHIDHDLPMIEADEGKLRMVFGNIVVNARESMADKGILLVRATRVITDPGQDFLEETEKHSVRISFEDKGTGIKKEHLSLLFDPFFTTKEPGLVKALGLGLAVAHAVIKRHQGTIEVESLPGSGTTVHLTLPAVPPELSARTAEPADFPKSAVSAPYSRHR
jgi:signal transduction histidine kinase